MPSLNSNSDLYDYLERVQSYLRDHGAFDLADSVKRAMQQASSLSTEFLGEARLVLLKVLEADQVTADAEWARELHNAIGQLDVALERRKG